jgi:hypothetical protein
VAGTGFLEERGYVNGVAVTYLRATTNFQPFAFAACTGRTLI